MLPRRLRPWLALATLVALASCELNPQPVLPGERASADPSLEGDGKATGGKATGGTTAAIQPDDPGATPGAGGAPGEVGSGGASPTDSGAGGADDGSPSGGQGAGGEAGAATGVSGAGGSSETP
jgi:hypothetical protein